MQTICSDKPIVQHLVQLFINYNIKHIVISPGSRNAPLTISFTNNPFFTCYSIPDERSAAFYALGMSKKLNEPVAIACTSGSAVLNYAPAIVEAYYQEIPLIVLTADRPPEWIDQEDGQTIRQVDAYRNYIAYAASLLKGESKAEADAAKLEIKKAIEIATANKQGPVHINLPFDEPLYNTVPYTFNAENLISDNSNACQHSVYKQLIYACNKYDKIMILAGVLAPNKQLNDLISKIIEHKNIVVIAPGYSNLHHDKIISTPELIFNTIDEYRKIELQPDLLITIGASIVTKSTKLFLRKYKAKRHFDIDFNESRIDTYLSLSDKIISSPSEALSYVNMEVHPKSSAYLNSFSEIQTEKWKKRDKLLDDFSFTDFHIYQQLFKSDRSLHLHFSNSTPIRYAELFKNPASNKFYCNRGTSGIDGNTSICSGFAMHSKNQTILVTGDISFGYDSNAFWNKHVPNNLKVIVINNGGGNIFNIINGPKQSNSLPFFETEIKKDTRLFCKSYNIEYLKASNLSEYKTQFETLLTQECCTVLEIFTDGNLSAKNYKALFQKLCQ